MDIFNNTGDPALSTATAAGVDEVYLSEESTIAAKDARFKDFKAIMETVEDTETLQTQLREKISKVLEIENPSTAYVKSVSTELAELLSEIANAHPIFKLAWIAVVAVYKAAKSMKELDEKLLQVIKAFRRGKLLTDASLEGSVTALGNANRCLLKDTLETYIKCLIQLISVCKDCLHASQSDNQNTYIKRLFAVCTDCVRATEHQTKSKTLDSILANLKQSQENLSITHGVGTFSMVSFLAAAQTAQQAAHCTQAQMTILRKQLKQPKPDKSEDKISFKTKKVTGREWFVELAEEWLEGQSDVFCFYGPAGCGKSRMAEIAFDLFEYGKGGKNDKQEERTQHDTFFFAFNHKDCNDPKTCIETLAYSIAEKFNTNSDYEITQAIIKICNSWSNGLAKKPQSLEGLTEDLLLTPLQGKKKNLIFVIDALDECAPESVNDFIRILGSQKMRRFRLFVTSRDTVPLPNPTRYEFDTFFQENGKDLKVYVTVDLLDKQKVLNENEVEEHAVQLVRASKGNFLVASLVLENLGNNFLTYESFEEQWIKLINMDLTSDELYVKIWSRVKSLDSNTFSAVQKLVCIMLSLKRPVKLNGLAALMGMDAGPLKALITHIEPLLMETDNSKNIMQFKHKTTVEFLGNQVPIQPVLLAEKCIELLGSLLRSLNSKDYSKAVNTFASGINKYKFKLKSDATLYFIENWTETLITTSYMPEHTVKQVAVEYGHFLLAACIKKQNELVFEELLRYGASIDKLLGLDLSSSTVLYESAKLGLANVCQHLLESKTSKETSTTLNNPEGGEAGQTPLHIAVQFKHFETVKVLVEHNASILTKDSYGLTPYNYSSGLIFEFFNLHYEKKGVQTMTELQMTIYDRNFELFKDLHTKSGMLEPNSKDNENTGYHYLATYYSAEILAYVHKLSNFEESMSLTNSLGETPLFLAVKKGNKETVTLFLNSKANIESENKDGDTPFTYAAFFGKLEIMDLLLKHVTKVESKNKNGNTPLALAAWQGHKEIVKLLLIHHANIEAKNKNEDTPLALAAFKGCTETLELLLDWGANIEAKNKNGNTPLAIAALQGHKEAVELLLVRSAKIESLNNKGNTPLALAAWHGHKETVELLFDKGAMIESHSNILLSLKAIIRRMLVKDHKRIVEILLDNDSRKESQNKIGNTPLALAASEGHKETVELLLFLGAKIDSQNEYGDTPLGFSAFKGHKETVKLLLDEGATVESQNIYGNTPLVWAALNGQKEIVELLLDCGASINGSNKRGKTPLTLAIQYGHKQTADLLRERGARERTLLERII
ncbi:hypothetical protein HDU79_010287 [Rhizoclosmatium sp. JEL0117]|nr:hypothetical protein HDU79_010287 [Rhizoclosmatium sp. JEL0117]